MQAHLKAQSFYSVVANIRGRSAEEVAGPLLDSQELRGLQVGSACTDPNISPVPACKQPTTCGW